jgi:hypothetical protein
MNQTRRLAAILAADVAGYLRLTGADEGGTLKGSLARQRASHPWGTPQYWAQYDKTMNVGLRRAGLPDE